MACRRKAMKRTMRRHDPHRFRDCAGPVESGRKKPGFGGIRQLSCQRSGGLQWLPHRRRAAKLQLREQREPIFFEPAPRNKNRSQYLLGWRHTLRSGCARKRLRGRVSEWFNTTILSARRISDRSHNRISVCRPGHHFAQPDPG